MLRRPTWLASLAAVTVLVSGLASRSEADKPKNDGKKEQKKEAFPFPIPDLDKLLPPGFDPQQADQLRKQLEMLRKQMEELQKQFPGGLPGGLPGGFPGGLPGGLPGFPGGKLPGNLGDLFGSSQNRLGATIQQPSAILVDQLDLPKNQGMVLTNVKANSAAAKAGLKSRDILLELNGKPVSSNTAEFLKELNAIKTDEAVDAVVLRKAKRETVKGLKLPDPPKANLPGFPGGFPGGLPGGFPGGLPGGLPNLPKFQPGQFPFPAGAQKAIMTLARNADGSFTGQYQAGNQTITVTGKIADGKTTVSNIEVNDAGKSTSYGTIDEVPEALRENVRGIIRLTEKP